MIIRTKSNSGFTLVELAIVMIVIGLLIGGVLKGQELIENSRVIGTIQQVKSLESSLLTFQDNYNGMPGDIFNATTSIPSCTASNFCLNGNGNRMIGTPYTDGTGLGAKFYGDSETVQFWKHLALANLIPGVAPEANPSSPMISSTHPTSPFGGVWEMYYDTNLFSQRGNMLRLSGQGLSPTQVDTNGLAVISPSIAYRIEQRIDDGNPVTGKVLVWDYNNFGCDNLLILNPDGSEQQGIDPSATNKSCVMFFVIR